MSRVDEALQRAREQQKSVDSREPRRPVTSPAGVDVAAFAEEPFPIELGEHRKVRETQRPVAAAPAEAPAPAPARTMSLMERVNGTLAEKIVIDQNMAPSAREQYRRLAATLHHAQLENSLKVIMVTSAVAGEGKTLTASNLALTFSESYGRSVLLIDADLRRPTLHTVFGIEAGVGLHQGLTAPELKRVTIRQVSPRLAVLPAGAPTTDPMAGLTSDRLRHLVDEARENFDWVIIDTPPLALLPDAHLLTSVVDGAVLVVRADSTPYELVKRAVDTIGRERTLGVVLNGVTRSAGALYGYGYDYEDRYYGTPTPPAATT